MISYDLNRIKKIKTKFVLPKVIESLVVFFAANQKKLAANFEHTILVQTVEDPYNFGIFGAIVTALQKDSCLRIEQYNPRSLNVEESVSIWKFLVYRFSNPVLGNKWTKAYNSFAPFLGYKFTTFHLLDYFITGSLALRLFKNLQSTNNLNNLYFEGIFIGDLINDTYLRFKPSPYVLIKDPYLFYIIWQSLRLVRSSKKYFLKTQPSLLLISYSTYLQHGIPARVALHYEVPVFTFGNYQEFAKKLNSQDYYHTKNPNFYRSKFKTYSDKERLLSKAEEYLERKISGEIDFQFSYMKQSAYLDSDEVVPDVRGAFIVFLHDFYDSPHVYPEMIFNDFWEWTCYTIDLLNASQIKYFIKPHPNQINLNDQVLINLQDKYPNLHFLSPKITNKQLVLGGVKCAITVYGSVAHEMAYFGVRSISCARHPHVNYDFTHTAKSKEEYEVIIKNHYENEGLIDLSSLKAQSLEFYYMHNLDIDDNEKELLQLLSKYRDLAQKVNSDDSVDLVKAIIKLSSTKGFKAICDNLIQSMSKMDSNKFVSEIS